MSRPKERSLELLLMVIILYHSCLQTEGHSDMYKKVKYHLTELRHGLQELKTSHVHKRSANLDHEERIYSSLVAFCSELTINDASGQRPRFQNTTAPTSAVTTNAQQSLRSLVLPDPEIMNVPDTSPISTWPQLFPLRVQAERDGTRVWLLFDIVHTAPAYLTRDHSFDYKKVYIDFPNLSSSPVKSKVRLFVDASICVGKEPGYEDGEASISFSFQGQSRYHVTVSIDLCMFDKFWNETGSDGDGGEWEINKDKIISQEISIPFLKVVSPDPGGEIVIQRGHDVVLELDIHLQGGNSNVRIHAHMWDRRQKGKILISTILVNVDRGSIVAHPANVNSDKDIEGLLSVDILNKTSMKPIQNDEDENNSTNGGTDGNNEEDAEWNMRARLRVTIKTSVGKMSGKLMMSYFSYRYDHYKRQVVKHLTSTREIILKLPHRSNVLPKNTAQFHDSDAERAFECDENGIKYYPKHGKNCTVFCYALGTDLKDIYITDAGSRREPVESVSYVLDGQTSAFAMIDVGPSSKTVDGTYRCTVVTKNGRKKHKDLKLITYLFTNVTNLSIKDFENFTTGVNCTAIGKQPLNMTVTVSTDYRSGERIDNKPGIILREYNEGNQKDLRLLIPTDNLKYPMSYISCDASGERGRDGKMSNLGNYIKNHNPLVPEINKMPNMSSIIDFGNGTIHITCSAKGGKPMTFWVTFGGNAERYRIDNSPENKRSTRETEDGAVLNLFIRKEDILGRTSWVGCRASNEFGEGWFHFNLRDWLN